MLISSYNIYHKHCTPHFTVFSVSRITMSLTLFWGICQVIIIMNIFIMNVTSWHWAIKCAYNVLAWVCSTILWDSSLCFTMVYKLTGGEHKWQLALVRSRISSSYILACRHMTLAISMLNNIFFLHIEIQNHHRVSQHAMLNVIMQIFSRLKHYSFRQVESYWKWVDMTFETPRHLLWPLHK